MITGARHKSAGFSMIEVLVSLLIIVVGVLGMVGLQSKAIPYTQDSVQRNTAMMLASDLLELMRASQFDTSKNIKDFQKAPGAAFPNPPASCVPTPASITDQLGCWGAQAASSLPGASALASGTFVYVCWSTTPGDVGATSCPSGQEVEIQLAWTVQPGGCMDNTQNTTCTYKLRTRL